MASEEIMESAGELHEARVLMARIEVQEADRARLTAEIDRLKDDYRRILALQADRDYRRRRAEWRAQQGAACARDKDSVCA